MDELDFGPERHAVSTSDVIIMRVCFIEYSVIKSLYMALDELGAELFHDWQWALHLLFILAFTDLFQNGAIQILNRD